MKENENKKPDIRVTEGRPEEGTDEMRHNTHNKMGKLKKPLIFALMGVVFLGCMYLIFKPSPDKKETGNIGLNEAVPQASETDLQSDKQKAYEQEMLERKNQEKRNALLSLSDYWNTDDKGEPDEAFPEEEGKSDNYDKVSHGNNNPALNSYRNVQNTLGSFYEEGHSETQELRKQLEELKGQLAEKEAIPKTSTVEDQLALMEKSYQMAAKYLPSNAGTGAPADTEYATTTPASSPATQKGRFVSMTVSRKNTVSALYREPSDSAFLAGWNENKNRGFYTAGSAQQESQPKNSIKACVQETQTVIGESGVRLRLLEPAQTPDDLTIPKGTIITANAKLQAGRLQLKVTSIELDGNIIPVDITIYGLDGQQGLHVPYSPEMNALTEMAGNMSQTSGTNLMLTNSAGQQIAADLSRGVVQGISGYFSKKVSTPKVTLKAGHQLFLVSKK